MNGLAGCYVSSIGKPHEYFDLTGMPPRRYRSLFATIGKSCNTHALPADLIVAIGAGTA